jgi:tetratricopeptide (TPR) repeat protein
METIFVVGCKKGPKPQWCREDARLQGLKYNLRQYKAQISQTQNLPWVAAHDFLSFIQNTKHPMLFKRFPLRFLTWCFCWAFTTSSAWADASTEIETLLTNQQWLPAQQAIEIEMQKSDNSAKSPQWRLMLSQALAGMGKSDQAVDVLRGMIQDHPELPEPYNNLGVLLAAQGQFHAAIEALNLAIQARPDYKIALQNLGDLYAAMAQQAHAKARAIPNPQSLLPLPTPLAGATTLTNIQTLRKQ